MHQSQSTNEVEEIFTRKKVVVSQDCRVICLDEVYALLDSMHFFFLLENGFVNNFQYKVLIFISIVIRFPWLHLGLLFTLNLLFIVQLN